MSAKLPIVEQLHNCNSDRERADLNRPHPFAGGRGAGPGSRSPRSGIVGARRGSRGARV